MIITEISDMFERAITYTCKPKNELNVIELGDIVIKNCMNVKGKLYAKEWWNASNVASHTSIDVNGRGGSLQLDLGTRLSQYDNTADLICNGGTAEHVENIYECFKNMYLWSKVGGITITWGPPIGTAKHHSPWAYALYLPMILATYCGYALAEEDIRIPISGRNPLPKDNVLLCYTLQKITDQPFITKEQWDEFKVVERR